MINVLHHALRLVDKVHPNMTAHCRRFVSFTLNDMGVGQPVWEEFDAVGQIQPQSASKQENAQNINQGRLCMNVWIKAELHTTETQPVADQIVFDGEIWNVITVTNWNPGNGWGTYTITRDRYRNDKEKDSEAVAVDGESVSADESSESQEEPEGTLDNGGLVW